MSAETEDLQAQLEGLMAAPSPENEAQRAALQEQAMEISREFDEIAQAVEDLTAAMMESFGLTEDDLT